MPYKYLYSSTPFKSKTKFKEEIVNENDQNEPQKEINMGLSFRFSCYL